MRNIDANNAAASLAYLRLRKQEGKGKVADVLYVTDFGRESPINTHECPTFRSIQFYDCTGNGLTSTAPDEAICAALVYVAGATYIWVRAGHESLLSESHLRDKPRLRFFD